MKQRIVSFFLTLVLLLGAFVIPTFATVDVFTDVPGYWAADDIYWAYENGIAAGVGQNTFAPRASLTRAMFVAFLYRTAKLVGDDVSSATMENPFADVREKDWYYTSALWAYSTGIVAGTGTKNGKIVFSPTVEITREQTCAMLHRYLADFLKCEIGTENAPLSFADASKISSWARTDADIMSAIGIFAGDTNGNFSPKALTERGAAVSLCRRIYNVLRPDYSNDPQIRCVGFKTQTLNSNIKQASFLTGRLRFRAILSAENNISISTPLAQDPSLRQINAVDYFTIDGQMHTYDIVKLEKNAILFFCDGEKIGVYGKARTYSAELTDEQIRIGLEYQNPTEPLTETVISLLDINSTQGCVFRLVDESPLGLHGALTVQGSKLVDRNGEEVVMNGMHLFVNAYNELQTDHLPFTSYEELKWLRDDWGINCIRLALIPVIYLNDSPIVQAQKMQTMYTMIENANRVGIYVLLDWHGYEEGPTEEYERSDPRIYQKEAEEFFDHFSEKYASYENIFYELYNEPASGKGYPTFDWTVTWNDKVRMEYVQGYMDYWEQILKPYSERLIEIIRANDPDAIVVANTPSADQHPEVAAVSPIDAENIMYAAHPWSDGDMQNLTTHGLRRSIEYGNICIFATETGFYPDEAGGFELAGLPKTYENAVYWLHSHQERYLANVIEKNNINYIYFLLLWNSNDDYRSSFKADRMTYDQGSGWSDDQLTFTGEYMRHWFRKRAGLEDDSWFTEWHVANDAYYDALIEEQLNP